MTWHAKSKGAYSKTSTEAKENAKEIYNLLNSKGWTLNAICGMLGNLGAESGYNPWRWQNDNIPSTNDSPYTNRGYGFTQFTPGGKYINDDRAKAISGYSPNLSNSPGTVNDAYAQMVFLDLYADYYPTETYPISYSLYKDSLDDVDLLAEVWLYNYERPGDPEATVEARRKNALYWYNYLSGETPEPPTPPTPTPTKKKSKMPVWMMIKRRI